ncbi:hypothetical protein ABG067_002869 [Albugo candida]
MTQYYTFQSFLTSKQAEVFFTLDHSEQINLFDSYLSYLSKQSADASKFTSSAKVSTCFAAKQSLQFGSKFHSKNLIEPLNCEEELVQSLLCGIAKSGFGAWGTENGYLPQKKLAMMVANHVELIGHTYVLEGRRKSAFPQLNSRSFPFYWCHAEKQKLMDVREKLSRKACTHSQCWQAIILVVDRVMCPDCIAFAKRFAIYEKAMITIEDPQLIRIFPDEEWKAIQCLTRPVEIQPDNRTS